MRYEKLDLNLLVALDALLQERNVSLAGDRLKLSQSATSSALGRLRDYFSDDLLVLKGRQMVLTPRAEGLIEPVSTVLGLIRDEIAIVPAFDPANSDRTLVIVASDYTIEVLLRRAMLVLAHEAPKVRFEFSPMTDNLVDELHRGQMDLLITLDTAVSTEHPRAHLYNDDFVVIGWTGNPALDAPMTRDLYEELGHVTAHFGKARTPSFEEWALKSQSVNRRIEIVAPSFTSVASFVIESMRIATMHRRLALNLAKTLPLKIMEVPFEIPSIRQTAQWASKRNADPAIRWLVQRLCAIAAETDV